MRVLLLNQFYPPDVAPTGRYLHDLALQLTADGHEVEVITSRRAYAGGERFPAREMRDGVSITRVAGTGFGRERVWGRLLDALGFMLGVAFTLRRRSQGPDVVVVLSTPPYLELLVRILAGRRLPRVHWAMDVYPDALAAAGWVSEHSPLWRGLCLLSRAQYHDVRLVLALGPFARRRLREYTHPSTHIESVPLWGGPPADDHSSKLTRAARGWSAEHTVLQYSGNMGLGHRSSEFLEAAEKLGTRGPLWAFIGAGAGRDAITRFAATHPHARIQLLPYVPASALAASLAAADVHLVSLSQRWEGILVPSKVPSAFCAGRPVIFVGPNDNEAAEWIRVSGGGWCVPENDVEALLLAVAAASDPHERQRRGAAALRFAQIHFDRERNSRHIVRLIEERAPGRVDEERE